MTGKDGHGPARLRPYAQRSLVPLLALASGTSAANIYYSQSILGLIARSFDVSGALAASAVAAAQFGYLMSLLHNRLRERRSGVFWCALVLTGWATRDSIIVLPRHGSSDGAPLSEAGTTSGSPASGRHDGLAA